jgi:hypothetical protein
MHALLGWHGYRGVAGAVLGIFVAKTELLPSACQDGSLAAGRQGDPIASKVLILILGYFPRWVSNFDLREPQALEAPDGISIRDGKRTTVGLESQ